MVAAAIIGAAVIGGVVEASSAEDAEDAQHAASQQANQTIAEGRDQVREDLAPFRGIGEQSGNMLMQRMPEFASPIMFDQRTLEGTPGYQFTLAQGLRGVQNSAAARGLGVSGAALKGAAGFATGLADATYRNRFEEAQVDRTNRYNMLFNPTALGQNAAAQTGTMTLGAAGMLSNNLLGMGQNQAAAILGQGNAAASTIGSIGNMLLMNQLMQQNGYTGLFGGSGSAPAGDYGFINEGIGTG